MNKLLFARIPLALMMGACFSTGQAAIVKPTEPYVNYTVAAGDTLQGLSLKLLRHPQQWSKLARLNGLGNPNMLKPGMVIGVPQSMLNVADQPKLATEGKLLSVQGEVSLNGQRVAAGAVVPEGARVQTAPASSAVVQLSDGSRLQLMPGSIADITSQHAYQFKDPASSISTTWFSGAIRLVEGVLEVFADKKARRYQPMLVTTPTSTVGIRGTQFRVAYEDPTSRVARTEVLEGRVAVDNTAHASNATVQGGYGVAVNPAVRDIKVTPLLPALANSALPALVLRARDGERTAAWTVGSLNGAAGYRAQLALDAEFNQILLDAKSQSPAIDLRAAPNGVYFARVRGVDSAGIEGYNAVGRITINDAPLPTSDVMWLREVQIGASAEHVPEGARLRLYTGSQDMPHALTVEVARNAAFTQAVHSLRADANGQFLIKDLMAGDQRYVRLSGSTPQGKPGTSPVFLLALPGNWGSTVFTLNQALQPVQ